MLTELKAVLKKPMLWITMVGIALVPALYNIIFLSSMWDPYGHVSDLPVAVVNEDKAASYNNKKMTIGKDMVETMAKNKNLDYHFVSSEKATKGLQEGDYYMIITLPHDLSQNAASILTDDPKQITIPYQTSKGHSFVASKMSETAAKTLKDSVSKNITSTYTKSLFKSMSSLKTGLGEAGTASQKLASGSKQLEKGSQMIGTNLATLATFSQTFNQGANTLYSGLQTYTGGVSQLAAGTNQLNSKSQELLGGVSQLTNGSAKIQQLVTAASQLNQGLASLSSKTSLSAEQSQQINQLIASLTSLNTAIQNYGGASAPTTSNADISSYLSAITAAAQNIVNSANTTQQPAASSQQNPLAAVQATSAYQKMSAADQSEIASALANTGNSSAAATTQPNAAAVSQANAILTSVQSIQKLLPNGQVTASNTANDSAALTQLKQIANLVLPSASTSLTTLSSGLTQINTALNTQIIPASSSLANGASLLGNGLSAGTAALTKGLTAYTNAVGTLNSGANTLAANSSQLTAGASQLANGANQISAGAGKLAEGSNTLTKNLTTLSSGSGQLAKALSSAKNKLSIVAVADSNAKTLASPVSIKHRDEDHVKNNGVGMAPYMMSAALMVMALSTNTIFREALSGKKAKNLKEWVEQKLAVNGLIAIAGAVILYFGVRMIGLTSNFELRTLGLTILTSITFMALVTALVTWHDKFGAFASLILLLLQLGSSAGTYPLAVTAKFFQRVNPYLPMSYSVSGLRETISMAGTISSQVLALGVFFLIFAVLGLLVGKRKVTLERAARVS
ncbi:cell wall surface protein [Streptococcus mutans]|nr:cell wall surface protein [Streptococcus mutans]